MSIIFKGAYKKSKKGKLFVFQMTFLHVGVTIISHPGQVILAAAEITWLISLTEIRGANRFLVG